MREHTAAAAATPSVDPSFWGDSYAARFEPDPSGDRMIVNMGPQHPSTHGVLRVLLELDGEYVVRADAEVIEAPRPRWFSPGAAPPTRPRRTACWPMFPPGPSP